MSIEENKKDSIINMDRRSNYNPVKAKEYYDLHKDTIKKRSKERWENLSEKDKQSYYKIRKYRRLKRKLKELE